MSEFPFNVVFEYTAAAGGYAGARYYTAYATMEEVDDVRAQLAAEETPHERIILVTEDEAEVQQLIAQTPVSSRIGAAIESSVVGRTEDGGPLVSAAILGFELQNAVAAVAVDARVRAGEEV